MVAGFYYKIPRRARLVIIFLLVVFLAYFIIRFLAAETKNIPPDFLRAQQEASSIADNIVSLADESAGNINTIADLDGRQKYEEALKLVVRELERNRDAREKAIELSLRLQVMAQTINLIKPFSASQTALEAVSSETTLISRLISYNDYLNQLLEVLRNKFLGRSGGDRVQELIKKINDEARAINDLNRGFNEKMREFDTQ